MPNENQMLHREQRQQVFEVEQVREHLTDLQRWETVPGKTIEQQRETYRTQMIEQEKLHNERFLQRVQQNMQPVNAVGAAGNEQPQQVQQPAQETWKERQKRKSRAKQANKKCLGADDVSMDISEEVQESFQCHHTAMQDHNMYERAEEAHVDMRVLRNFTYGYRTDRRGRPLEEVDVRRKEADRQYLEDYVSCDVQRRKPHLDRMVKQVLSDAEKYSTRDKFTLEYVKKNAGDVFEYGNRLTYFENVMKDPVNAPYFEALSQKQKRRLEIAVHNAGIISTFYGTIAGTKGVNINSGELYNEILAEHHEQLEMITPVLEETLREKRQMQMEFAEHEAEEMMEEIKTELMQSSEEMRLQAEAMVEEDYQGLNLTGFVTGYSFEEISKYRRMIENNFERYQQNQQIVDRLYQGLHHSVDSLGDMTCRAMAWQEIQDTIPMHTASKEQKRILKVVNNKMAADTEEVELMRDHIASHADALQHFLKNKPLSEPARTLLQNMGHNV